MLEWLVWVQGVVRSSLSERIDAFAASQDFALLWGMLPIAILFGMAHALTPGHGKTVVAAYTIGSGLTRWRSLMTAGAFAAAHVGSAVLLAVVSNDLIARTVTGAGRAPLLETVNWALLIVVGIWLIGRAALARPHMHGEGALAGFLLGLIPCPLTLFLMFYSLSKGAPVAGLTFAVSMLIGVGLVLGFVALLSALARQSIVAFLASRGVALGHLSRGIDALAGASLLIIAWSHLSG